MRLWPWLKDETEAHSGVFLFLFSIENLVDRFFILIFGLLQGKEETLQTKIVSGGVDLKVYKITIQMNLIGLGNVQINLTYKEMYLKFFRFGFTQTDIDRISCYL